MTAPGWRAAELLADLHTRADRIEADRIAAEKLLPVGQPSTAELMRELIELIATEALYAGYLPRNWRPPA